MGGTKDALFVRESSAGDSLLVELDAHAISYAFSSHAIRTYSPNPSNSRQFELEGRQPAAIAPSQFFTVDPKQLTHEIVALTLNASCIMRAVNAHIDQRTCSFAYVLSNSPAKAVDDFVHAIQTSL